ESCKGIHTTLPPQGFSYSLPAESLSARGEARTAKRLPDSDRRLRQQQGIHGERRFLLGHQPHHGRYSRRPIHVKTRLGDNRRFSVSSLPKGLSERRLFPGF